MPRNGAARRLVRLALLIDDPLPPSSVDSADGLISRLGNRAEERDLPWPECQGRLHVKAQPGVGELFHAGIIGDIGAIARCRIVNDRLDRKNPIIDRHRRAVAEYRIGADFEGPGGGIAIGGSAHFEPGDDATIGRDHGELIKKRLEQEGRQRAHDGVERVLSGMAYRLGIVVSGSARFCAAMRKGALIAP